MFGYVNVNQKELTQEQRQQYQSFYCGLCQELKATAGSKGRMLLNFDMTFLTILLTGLYESTEEEETFTCIRHPLAKKTSIRSEATSYAAKMNILLSYQNLEDDWVDNRSLVKKGLAEVFKKDYERIKKEYPRQATAIENYVKRLSVAESGKEQNLDAVSGLTGDMLAEIFDWKEDQWSSDLRGMGFYLGKFIYLIDAYEDMKKDELRGLYNPFIVIEKENKDGEFDTYVRLILTSMMAECAKSFERLPIIRYADILRNILYSGVWTKYEMNKLKKKRV